MNTLDKYLSAVLSGDISGLPEPQTNIEKYLAAALGVWDGELPAPISNADAYLYEIAMQGIGGGGGELPDLANPATVAMIRKGYQAINSAGRAITGTMAEYPAEDVILDAETTSRNIEAGYHSGGSVSVDLEEVTIAPTAEEQTVIPSGGKLISKVTVQAADIPEGEAPELPELSNPAGAEQIRKGYQAIDGDGEAITGTMAEYPAEAVILDAGTTSHTIEAGYHSAGSVSVALEEVTVKPTTEIQEITPSEGKLISKVTVQAAEASGGSSDPVADAIVARTITEYISDNIEKIGNYAFSSCVDLKSVESDSVISVGSYAFERCNALIDVELPNCASIQSNGFSQCSALVKILFPGLEAITAGAFSNCTSLEVVDLGLIATLPALFSGCTKLKAIILRGNAVCKLAYSGVLNGTPFASGGAGGTVYVPAAMIAEYQAATNWSTLYTGGSVSFASIEGSEYE